MERKTGRIKYDRVPEILDEWFGEMVPGLMGMGWSDRSKVGTPVDSK